MPRIEFDEEQRRVLDLAEGRHKVLAPPGSGKTELLAHRVTGAVESGRDPGRMACLTFTNRAARTMEERLDAGCDGVFVGNFHSFAAKHLRRSGAIPIGGAILDEEDAHLLAADALETVSSRTSPRSGPGSSRVPPFSILLGMLKAFANIGSRRRLGLAAPVVLEAERTLSGRNDSSSHMRRTRKETHALLARAEKEYRRQKRSSLAFDFDDLLNLTAADLASRSSPADPLLDWVQVDEAQDLNLIQWLILQGLTGPDSHVVLLGDTRQSIFSFMGGSPDNLETAAADYEEHTIGTNYRSPPRLLRFFNDFSRRVLAFPAMSREAPALSDDTSSISRVSFETSTDERRRIARELVPRMLRGKGSVAILSRTNRQAVEISAELETAGLRHFLVSHFDVFRTAVAKDFMAFLSILHRGGNRIAWPRVLRLLGATRTLKEARRVVNELFDAGIGPADLLAGIERIDQWSVAPFAAVSRRGRVVVFDVETTGLNPDEDDVVQIAAMEMIDGKPGRRMNTYLETDRPLGRSTEVHGITPALLDRKGVDRADGLLGFLEMARGSTLVAHNLEFDWSMVNANLVRAGLPAMPSDTPRLCTLEASRALFPTAERHTLGAMLASLKLVGRASHDALDDTLAAAALLGRIGAETRRRARRARRACEKHEAILRKLSNRLEPLLESVGADGEGETSFGEIFDRYRAGIERALPGYGWIRVEDLEDKLIRHMDASCPRAPLRELLQRHLARYALYREPDLLLDSDRLVVSTVHRAKGLEFDAVFVPGLVEGTYPSHFAVISEDPAAIAEEARILYVAISRARRDLVLSEYSYYDGPGKPGFQRPSRFLRHMWRHFER